MKHAALILLFSLTALSFGQERDPKIQIALLLDTSGSMDGLIDQAKTRLWDIINEMALARKRGRLPELEVALYEYGKSTLPAAQGYLTQLVPLSSDLDRVSEALFALRTNGGEEYCAQVIQAATTGLSWSTHPDDFKAIFIAGNEAFNQGSVPYEKVCAATIGKGIVINTIFCGNEAEGIRTHWKDGADLADGRFLVINQNKVMEVISTPQDAQLLSLGEKLNTTYLAYGKKGKSSKERQQKQDENAGAAAPSAAVQRVMAKASKAYKSKDWDLVDAAEESNMDVAEVAEEELPEPMKGMDDNAKRAYVETKAKERKDLQAQVDKLKKERTQYLNDNRKKETGTLDDAMTKVIRKQLKDSSFKFEDNKTPQN